MLRLLIAGGNPILVYPKPNHVPAEYTVLNFPVPDIVAAAQALAERGITLLRYNDGQDEQGIFRAGGPPIGWFSDPAGNVLSIIED